MHTKTRKLTKILSQAIKEAKQKQINQPEQHVSRNPSTRWPINCTVGPGLEGAIACNTKIGYVNGTRGDLVYRGYGIFDLCTHSTFEEVSYLLLRGKLPTRNQLDYFNRKLRSARHISKTIRSLASFPIEDMNTMGALRLGINLMRQNATWWNKIDPDSQGVQIIASDEDSIPMETIPAGEKHAIYEFQQKKGSLKSSEGRKDPAQNFNDCIQLISGVATITAAIARIRAGKLPIEPDDTLSHSANFLYTLTGKHPTKEEERIFDIALILHADHGMNASTFASMVVASTMSDIYFSIGSGIAALNGPLHGGANEQVLKMLRKIGPPEAVPEWFKRARRSKKRIMGFGHRVYKVYDPRARILSPLADHISVNNKNIASLYKTAKALEIEVISTLGHDKGIFPNVDFYSGLVYKGLGIPEEMFTPIFAVSRVSGWTARVTEYLRNNRIFRPRAIYTGSFDLEYKHISKRPDKKRKKQPKTDKNSSAPPTPDK